MPIILCAMLDDLIRQIDDHLSWRAAAGHPLAPTTFGFRAVSDGKLLGRLRDGGQITVEKMQRITTWIAADRAAIERAVHTTEAAA